MLTATFVVQVEAPSSAACLSSGLLTVPVVSGLASALTMLRTRGVRIAGALIGTGHSAAFFANALQSDRLCAVAGARVIAMDPAAIARVTGVDAERMIEHDPLMGQPVRHFAALGGVDVVLEDSSPARILAFATR